MHKKWFVTYTYSRSKYELVILFIYVTSLNLEFLSYNVLLLCTSLVCTLE